MSIATRFQQKTLGRKPEGIAAILLPFTPEGAIAWEAFRESLLRTHQAGLACAVNMDTGYANYLSTEEKNQVLAITRETLGTGTSFVAGAYIEGLEGDPVALYRGEMEKIADAGGTPILFQTARFHAWSTDDIVGLYAQACAGFPAVLGFELGRMFAPNGMIFDEPTVEGLMGIPELKGMKHSSLDRGEELKRLALRDRVRPDFRIYTGNDLGIDMIEFGSDYLLGLAAFCPDKFALRDQWWAEGDERYFALNDALQHLGNIAFRAPVPAYKHSCAVFQHLIGRIPSPEPHAKNPRRPDWEAAILTDCAARLGFDV